MASPNKKRPETWAKRFALNLKTTEDIRQKVENRAKKSGRSITLEVEQQLIKSFEIEEKDALNEELKFEMRGTIAALEQRIALIDERERALWPDADARALGKAFAMTLMAARHVSGQDWREDLSTSVIVAGAMRRLMDRCVRNSTSLFASLAIDSARVAAAADSIAQMVGPSLDRAMPPLPERGIDLSQWTGRAYLVTEFRDATTGEILETITGPEFDAANPEDRPRAGDSKGVIKRLQPIRDKVEIEDFTAYMMKDGTTKRISLHETAPVEPEPAARLVGQEEATRLTAGQKRPAGVLPPSLIDKAVFDEAMRPPRPDDTTESAPTSKPPAPARRRKAKV